MFYWNPWVVPFLLLAVGEIVLGTVVYRARPDRFQNRLLGFSLVVWGIAWGVAGMRFVMSDPGDFQAGYVTAQIGWLVYWGFYFAFMGTLDSPLSRPWSTRTGRWALTLGVVAGSVFFLTPAGEHVAGVGPGSIGRYAVVTTPLGTTWYLLTGGLAVYALLVGISYLRRSTPGTAARSEAKAFVAAFAARDVPYVVAIFGSYFALGEYLGTLAWAASLLGEAALALLLTYGILRHRILGIDLKVKWTVRRGTVVAVLAAAFFVVKETIEFFLPLEGLAASLGGAAVIGLLAFPAWRAAGRLADRMMPGVADTEEYRTVRKREVYRAAVEEALIDGTLSSKDRNVLAAIADQLGLSGQEARSTEEAAKSALSRSANQGR